MLSALWELIAEVQPDLSSYLLTEKLRFALILVYYVLTCGGQLKNALPVGVYKASLPQPSSGFTTSCSKVLRRTWDRKGG